MASLISVYDFICQLKKVLLGRIDEHWEDDGAFSVFDVIYNEDCSKIQFLGDNEAIKSVTDVLADEAMESKEKARQLLEIK